MKILIIDDEPTIRRTLSLTLEASNHQVVSVANGIAALKQVETVAFDAILLDLHLGKESGLDVMEKLLKADSRLSVIVFTAFATIHTAVEAMRRGAIDYLQKPFVPEELEKVLEKINHTRQLESRLTELESRIAKEVPEIDFETKNPTMKKVVETVMKAALVPATVLLLGESGTGKSVLARAIHRQSPRKDKAFITVHCPCLTRELLESELFGHVKGAFTGAVSETWGKVSAAEGGTLFLDEVGEIPLEIQPKLLRLLQEREYERVGESKSRLADVRVISATNRDLKAAVKAGQFREDLYYRLNVISVTVPPLRERMEDVLDAASRFLTVVADQMGRHFHGFSPETIKKMETYSWPGNLRELKNAIERAAILGRGDILEMDPLPENLHHHDTTEAGPQPGAIISLEELENEHIKRVLARTPSYEEAAHILGIDPATLYRKRKKMGGKQNKESSAEAQPVQ